MDKNDVRTVLHLTPPVSVEAYLEETGRASRDGQGAEAWLIYTPEDLLVLDDPRCESPAPLLDDLRYQSPAPPGEGRSGTGASGGESGGSEAAPRNNKAPSPPPAADAGSVARARRSAMIRYAASTHRCRREMLLGALSIEARDCTGCDVCGGEAWTEPPEREVILKVVRRFFPAEAFFAVCIPWG